MITQTFDVGTRGSGLALKQAAEVVARLAAAFPAARFHPRIVRTTGDVRTDVPLAAVGAEGLFVRELERALQDGEVALAVHSLKDLPTRGPGDLEIGAILARADPRDALVTREATGLHDLPDSAVIGTGSLRRRAQLALINPRWTVRDVRGNLETRLARMDEGRYDALILAAAGLERLGHGSRIRQVIPFTAMLPAPGQGAIAIQIRTGDAAVAAMVRALDDAPTRAAVTAERALLRELEGGCQVPLGAHAEAVGDHLILEAVVATPDGGLCVRRRLEGPLAKPAELGVALARELRAGGAGDILAAMRASGRDS